MNLYKLNLPTLREIALPGAIEKHVSIPRNTNHYVSFSAKEFLRPEFHTMMGFEWDLVVHFYKSKPGAIHTDTLNPQQMVWGVNFILAGTDRLQYWNFDDVERDGFSAGETEDPNRGTSLKWKAKTAPREDHEMPPGAYLVNASVPHASNPRSPKWSFILRASYTYGIMTWPQVIEAFRDVLA